MSSLLFRMGRRSCLSRSAPSHWPPFVRHCYDGSQRKDVTVNKQACLRLSRADTDGVANLGGWLTTVVGRVCLDMLRSRRSCQEDYVGTWLPEPIVSPDDELIPSRRRSSPTPSASRCSWFSTRSRRRSDFHSCCTTCSACRSRRSPRIVDRTPAAARQLASRARRRVRGATPKPDPDVAQQRKVVAAFLAASRSGDFDALLAVLDPDVLFRFDGGGSPAARAAAGHRRASGCASAARAGPHV